MSDDQIREDLRALVSPSAPDETETAWHDVGAQLQRRRRSAVAPRLLLASAAICVALAAVLATRGPGPEQQEVDVRPAAPAASSSTSALTRPAAPTPQDMLMALSDAKFQQNLSGLSPAEQDEMRQKRAQATTDRIPVAGAKGFAGYITSEASTAPFPNSRADLFTVLDENGATVAYWGGEIGVIDKTLVDSGQPLDFVALKAATGLGLQPRR